MTSRRLSHLIAAVLLAGMATPGGAQSFRAADSIVESGIARGIYPGAVLLIGRGDRVLHRRGFGHLTWDRRSPVPTPDSTLWDLASLTKVVATTPAVMRLVEQRRVGLDSLVTRYLPRFRGGARTRVTVRMLLDHTSGLPSYREFFREAPTRDSAIALLYATPLRNPPGQATVYSDLNFMLLGLLVESVSGEALGAFARREVLAPAGMTQTGFRSGREPSRTAPTGSWRGTAICCEVNDQNAVRLGGAAGHAGVFGTGDDLARYLRLWLGDGSIDGRSLFDPASVRTFLSAGNQPEARYLGWERPPARGRDDSAYGQLPSPVTFGHTGWTGTLIWADPARKLFVVFLTNRSYAPRASQSMRQLRAVRGALADSIVAASDRDPGR
ncbi:MAG: beta-lactamase family protein [Gemmatimonadota bacterium]|nr:beta-lactamase family protein [Gemmatimonadota bacterium]MDH4348093.1 beta-lactamase family protein [Gemmatimonadota bacterium]MDH5282830.1 beta-lactamase family protein [Gemmatimonadota bacterium]